MRSDCTTVHQHHSQSVVAFCLAAILGLFISNCGGGGSPPPAPSPPAENPTPSISSLAPSGATAGGPAFDLTVKGKNFVSDSLVIWNGTGFITTYKHSGELSVAVSAYTIRGPGNVVLTVFNPPPGGGTSNAVEFPITSAVPTITALSPSRVVAGIGNFGLTVSGTGFNPTSVVYWNGNPLLSSFTWTSTEMHASISASQVASPGEATVTVVNPPPAGGTSNALTLSVSPPEPLAITTSVLPPTAPGKSFAFMLMATGGALNPFYPESSYTWGLDGGALPEGLQMGFYNGSISGTVQGSTSSFTVRVSDFAATPNHTTRDLTVEVKNPPLALYDSLQTATPISNGKLPASISPYGDVDYYSFHATAGATVRIEITARRLATESFLDSILEIQDASGSQPYTCRTPDQPRDPLDSSLIQDPTPDAFDDACLSDDIEPGVVMDSLLEFQPAATGTYYVTVRDFRGDGRPDLIYELSLSGAD